MHEVAVPTSTTLSINKLPAASLPKISDLGELGLNGLPCVEATLEHLHCFHCRFFIDELNVSISNDVVTNVVTHHQILDLAVVRQFLENFRVKSFEVVRSLIQQLVINHLTLGDSDCDRRVLVHVPENQGL